MPEELTIYHNPRCSKSRQTLALINQSGIEPRVIEYLKNPPTPADLEKILAKLDINVKDLIRTNEMVYKERFKGREFTDREWMIILSENPQLIERPIVLKGHRGVIGRPPENVAKLL